MQTAIQKAMTTNDTFVTYDYTDPDGKVTTYTLPSYDAIINRLKAVEESINALQTGQGSVNLSDGSHRTVTLSSIAHTPGQITGLADPSTFTVDANWFFEELMFPGAKVNIDLTGQIEDSADRVRVNRIILDATVDACESIWMSDLSVNSYDYASLKVLLSNNGVPYREDEETVELPLVSNTVSGTFQVIADPEFIDGNVWYQIDSITYSTISSDGVDQGKNNVLSIGDRLAYKESIFEIVSVDQNDYKIHIKRVNGVDSPGMYAMFTYYQDPFRSKTLGVRFGAHEYNIIYFKGVSEAHNLLADIWSDPIKFSSDELVLAGSTGLQNTSFAEYYNRYIVDWGAEMIAEAKEAKISAWFGTTPNAPALNAGDFRVIQINTQINAAIDTTDVKNIAADIESVKSQISSLKNTIAAQKTDLQSAVNTHTYNSIQQQIATNTTDLKNLQTTYTTLVDSFQTIVRENSAVTAVPKYHIRGFFAVPAYQYRDEDHTIPEEIIGFDVAYRYIKEDNTGVSLATYNYTNPDGTEISATYSDWNIVQGPVKTKVYDEDLGRYIWKSENVADGTEVNVNQIDIPISKGEKVEFKVRSISEAGYPANPLRSVWSNSIIMDFPDSLATGNEIADLVQAINDDAINITVTNILDSVGVTSHLSDTVANTGSVTGTYYNHLASNIAYEDTRVVNDDGGIGRISMSLQEKIESMEVVNDDSSVILAKCTNDIKSLTEKLNQKITEYDSSVKEIKDNLHYIDTSVSVHTNKFDIIVDSSNYSLKTCGSLHFTNSHNEERYDICVLEADKSGKLRLKRDVNKQDSSVVFHVYNVVLDSSNGVNEDYNVRNTLNRLNSSVSSLENKATVDSSRLDRIIKYVEEDCATLEYVKQVDNLALGIQEELYNIKDGSTNNIACDDLTIGQENGGTRLSTNKLTGSMYVFDARSNESLGSIHASDVYLYSGSIVTGKQTSLIDVIDQVNISADDISTLREEYDEKMSLLDRVIQTSGDENYVVAYNIQAKNELTASTILYNNMQLREKRPFMVTNSSGQVVNGHFCDIILYARNQNETEADQGGATKSVYDYIMRHEKALLDVSSQLNQVNNGVVFDPANPELVKIKGDMAIINDMCSKAYYLINDGITFDNIDVVRTPKMVINTESGQQYVTFIVESNCLPIMTSDVIISKQTTNQNRTLLSKFIDDVSNAITDLSTRLAEFEKKLV